MSSTGFLPVPLAALESETYLGAEPTDRATWLALLTYSFRRLAGGRIEGAAAWPGRKLERVLGVTLDELGRGFNAELEADTEPPAACEKPVENTPPACGKPVKNLWKTKSANAAYGASPTYGGSLWAIIGADIIVKFYPYDFERKIIASRTNGRKGGRPKSQNNPGET